LTTIQSCFKTDSVFFSFHAGSEMIKTRGRILQSADRIRMRQRRQHARSLQHRAALSESEAVYDSTVANEPSPWPPPSPPSVLPSSQTPLTLTIPAVARPVSRRLTITMEQPQAAETVVESPPRLDQTASNPASPTVNCSQFKLQQYQEQRERSPPTASISPYPTPPEAPPKDQYIWPSTSDSGSDCAEPYGGAPAEKVFHREQLHIHKAYTGPEPVACENTGLYEGGQHDWYEAYSEVDIRWLRRIDFLYAVTTSAGGDHSDNKTAPGVSVGAQV
jgi:hypothetical protein